MAETAEKNSDADSTAAREREEARLAYRVYILMMCMVVGAFANFDRRILSMLITPIKTEFGLDDGDVGLLLGVAFSIPYVLVCIPLARLADRWSRRNVVAMSVTVWGAFTLASNSVQSFVQLFLCRIGVGAGEAGGVAPMQALISDNFSQKYRGSALSIYLLGPSIGMGLGTWFGGWALTHYDWRTAFFIAGLPGFIIGPLFWLTMPNRSAGFADGVRSAIQPTRFWATFSFLLRIRTIPFLLIGIAFSSLLSGGLLDWVPQLLERTHGLDPKAVGARLGLALTLGSVAGHVIGGPLADFQARRDVRWHFWQPALLVLVSVGVHLTAYHSDAVLAVPLFGLVTLLGGLSAAPMIYIMTTLAPANARATSASISSFVLNIVGMGLGPWLVGMISDLYAPIFGIESLKMAMVTTLSLSVVVAISFFLASRHYAADLAAARLRLQAESALI